MKKSFLVGLSCVLLLSGCGNKEVEQPPIVEEVIQPEVVEKIEEPEIVEPEVTEPEIVEPEVIEPEIEEPEIIVEEPVSFEIVPENNIVSGRGSLVFLHESNLVGTDINSAPDTTGNDIKDSVNFSRSFEAEANTTYYFIIMISSVSDNKFPCNVEFVISKA